MLNTGEKQNHTTVVEKNRDGVATAGLVTGTVGTAGVLALTGYEIAKSIAGAISSRSKDSCASNVGGSFASMVASALPTMMSAFVPAARQVCGCGCGCSDETATLRARIATLEAEKYSSSAATAESNRLIDAYIRPYGQEIADARVREAKLQAEVDCLKKTQELQMQIIQKDIQIAKQEAACCCVQNANALASLESRFGSITKTVVSNDNVCPGWGSVTITPSATTTSAAA